MKNLSIRCFIFFMLLTAVSCVDMHTIRPVHAKDFYQRGLGFLSSKSYDKALKDFTRCISVADPVAEEYYASMCRFEISFTYSLMEKNKLALREIEILLSQVASSKEPRILGENLRAKIVAGKSYQNASY